MTMSLQRLSVLFLLVTACRCANDLNVPVPAIVVQKCCLDDEILNEKLHCRHINETRSTPWAPLFYDAENRPNVQVRGFKFGFGVPDCGAHQPRPVYEYQNASDRLFLRAEGFLRHYTHYKPMDDGAGFINEAPDDGGDSFYDYVPGTYCLDKALVSGGEAQAAVVCVPAVGSNSDFTTLIKQVINPMLHVINIICLLTVAIVYFILPPLRDLVGNIISTIAICLIVSQVADLVGIFTEFSSHVSFIVADVIMYFSLLAAFFWMNSLGYYIWRTFRSRNVFLRVSDGRKYCYYSSYAWGATLVMTLTALIAHFLFDANSGLPLSPHDQQTIGWLGIAIFFTPIAFTIIVDIYFYLTTARSISRMAPYGRIHGRMKFSFELYIQLFLVMTTAWLFLLLSWLQYEALIMAHIVTNALLAPFILVICVLGRQSVRSLLSKSCCQGNTELQWGEEMMSMTSN